MEKAFELAEKIINQIDDYSANYTTTDGKNVATEESIKLLNAIIVEGFSLHKYIVEKKFYEKIPVLTPHLTELGKYIEKLQMNKENAEKLHLSDAIQIWNQAKVVIAVICCDLLDYKDSNNEK